jgi:hypothetical protein
MFPRAIRSYPYLLLIVAVSIGCAPAQPNIQDGGLVSGEPCGPPCFWGIVPGETTEGEALEIVPNALNRQNCRVYNNEAGSGLRGISCDNQIGLNFVRGTDVVGGIAFSPSDSLTVGDFVAMHGDPDAALVTALGLPENPHTTMQLYFDGIWTTIGLDEQEGFAYMVSASTLIMSVGYAEPDFYAVSHRYTVSWTGYGEYQRSEPSQ